MFLQLTTIAAVAVAQDQPPPSGFDTHGFHLVAHDSDLRDPLVVQRPGPFTQGDWFFSGLAEYAKAPLVRFTTDAAGEPGGAEALVDDLLALNLSTGIAIHDYARFDLTAPIFGLTTGLDPIPEGPAMGDLRLASMLVVLRPDPVSEGGGAGLALVGHLDIPSGTPERFLGQRDFAGGARLAFTYEASIFTVSADVGAQINPALEASNVQGRDRAVAGVGIGVLASDLVGFTLEGTTSPPLQASRFPDISDLPPIEAILSMRVRARTGPFWTLGVAGGITDAPGVAAARAFLGMGYGAREPLGPGDHDTLMALRTTDLCPTEPETRNGWKDDDGCPDRLGTLGIDVRFRGASREAEAVIVGPTGQRTEHIGLQGLTLDAVPGSQWTVRATSGCLAGEASATAADGGSALTVELAPVHDATVRIDVLGTDGLPLSTAQIVWISERPGCVPSIPQAVGSGGSLSHPITSGTHTLVVTAPQHNVYEAPISVLPGEETRVEVRLAASKIVVEREQIRILEKVQFETAKAVLRSDSYGLLDEIAATIITNPDLGRVEVGGHTDSRGSASYNQTLSEDRARAVRTYLLGKGVPPARLIAVGYGESLPIDTNKTPAGREHNRRVEFKLIDVEE